MRTIRGIRPSCVRRVATAIAFGCAACATAQVPREAEAARLPVLDMHLHAKTLDPAPPPPTAVCTPLDPPVPLWDQRRPFVEAYAAMLKTPPCDDPVWSPITDAALRDETVAAMERANVIAVLGGVGPERSPV